MAASRWGRRLVYGGHVLSVAHALAASGLANALWMAAWNGGTHLAPVFAGDTIYAATEVAEVVPAPGRDDLGALRLRLCASKRQAPRPGGDDDGDDGDDDGARAEDADDAQPVLELDYWALMPRRPA
jgi:2-methylfumaryl-CoA hydratase